MSIGNYRFILNDTILFVQGKNKIFVNRGASVEVKIIKTNPHKRKKKVFFEGLKSEKPLSLKVLLERKK